jgi:hypothetical protein
VRPDHGGVPDVDADLKDTLGADGAGEEDVGLGLEVGDHVLGVRVVLDDVGVVGGDVGGEDEGVLLGVFGDALGDGVVGVEDGSVGLHLESVFLSFASSDFPGVGKRERERVVELDDSCSSFYIGLPYCIRCN